MLYVSKCVTDVYYENPCEVCDLTVSVKTKNRDVLTKNTKLKLNLLPGYLNVFILPRKKREQVTRKTYFLIVENVLFSGFINSSNIYWRFAMCRTKC